MTLYPPLKSQIDKIVKFMREVGVRFEISKVVDEFWTQINIEGDSDPMRMFNRCVNSDCFIIKRGKLGKCPVAMNGNVFNEYFNTKIQQEVIDLSDSSVSIGDIHNYLYNPIITCSYCGQEKYYEWERTDGKIDISEMLCSYKV